MSVAPALPASGSLSMSTIQTAMGGTGAIHLSKYSRKAGITSVSPTISQFQSKTHAMEPGFLYRAFAGYFGNLVDNAPGSDDVTWFDRQTETSSGLVTDMSNISTATNGTYAVDVTTQIDYSVDWFGYFFSPSTGTYTFNVNADDGCYVWIGPNALAGYTYSNALINDGNLHGAALTLSGTYSMTAGTYYPMRIVFGQHLHGNNLTVSFSGPGISTTSNFSDYIFSPLGTASAYPGLSARLIKKVYATTTDGAYYINVNGVSTLTYCLMDSKWDGGGWMMLMKATRGDTFPFTSSYWTDTGTTLNVSAVNRTDGDAKFNTMNYSMVKDVLALWPDAGTNGGSVSQADAWSWMVNNYYSSGTRCTFLTGVSTTNTRDSPVGSNPTSFSGYSTAIWSAQNVAMRHVFGGGSHLTGPPTYAAGTWGVPNNMIRWGFLWNENQADNFTSSDVVGGIGFGVNWRAPNPTWSAGDWIGCCQSNTGLNRSMRVEVYGR